MAKVLISGTFDVENYGDCLFPIIAQSRLEKFGFEVAAVSPTANRTRWTDAAPPIAISSLAEPGVDIIGGLIGGGNIIHARSTSLQAYRDCGVAQWAYPSLWLGFSLLLACRDAPVYWNAPGVPTAFGKTIKRDVVRQVLEQSPYVTVRDEASKSHLDGLVEPRVVPDTATEISRVWPRSQLERHFKSIVEGRGLSAGQKFVAIHVKRRAVLQGYPSLARLIDEQCTRMGLTPILVSLAPCHADDEAVSEVAKHLRIPHILLDRASELKQIAAVLAHSEAYIGPSLHGYITSYSYGTPSALIAQPRLLKFAGFAAHVGREDDVVDDWESAFQRVEEVKPRRADPILQSVQEQLDAHWNIIGKSLALRSKSVSRPIEKFILDAVAAEGMPWLLQPSRADPLSHLTPFERLRVRARAAVLRRISRLMRRAR